MISFSSLTFFPVLAEIEISYFLSGLLISDLLKTCTCLTPSKERSVSFNIIVKSASFASTKDLSTPIFSTSSPDSANIFYFNYYLGAIIRIWNTS